MHPPSLFLEALSYAASKAYSFNDRQGGIPLYQSLKL